MNFKTSTFIISLILVVSLFSGCIGSDDIFSDSDNVSVINDEVILGVWIQNETNEKLIFLNNHTFVRTLNADYSGTWRIENNKLILNSETWDYSQNIFGDYLGREDVSFGTIKNEVLSFTSINDDPLVGFPFGDFYFESADSIQNEDVPGVWEHAGINYKLTFAKNNTFKQTVDGYDYSGTWRIENNILILNMELWDYSQSFYGELIGNEDVSFGIIKNGILSFVSVNDDPLTGFPSGNFHSKPFVPVQKEDIIGTWDHTKTNSMLVFSNDNTFKETTNGYDSSGTWRIEDNRIILTMGTYSHVGGKYLGKEDVSFGTLTNDILSFKSINDDYMRGFPAGDFSKV